MSGPYPPQQGELSGPYPVAPGFPPNFADGRPFDPSMGVSAYPAPLPYRRRRNWRVLTTTVLTLAAVVGIATAIVFAARENSSQASGGITAENAQRAIQHYLNALSNKDLQVISRNALCGLYDGVHDRRSDDALARMSSDAFQKQFSKTEVTAVDTIVFQSPNSAQVLFTMNTAPARGAQDNGPEVRQGVAQLLSHNNEVLVCSYVLRTAGAF